MQRKGPELKATRVSRVDIRSLPIGPEEAFVFSRVERDTSVADVVLQTGLSTEAVTKALHRLAALSAVTLHDENGVLVIPRKPSPAPVTKPKTERAPSLYPASEIDEPGALPADRKRQILDWYHGADLLTHYELFGLPRDASKKEVKDCYFEVVRLFHPDRYFGKDLGAFKTKLERAFQRLTEAHDTLTRQRNREDYDRELERRATLPAQKQSQRDEVATRIADFFEQLHSRPTLDVVQALTLDSAPPVSDRMTPVGQPPEAARAASRLHTPRPPADKARRATPRPPPADTVPPAARSTKPPPPADDEARRKELGRKLKPSSSRPPPARHAEDLKRHLAMADEELKADNPVAAVNALRMALALDPDAPHIALRLANAEKRAAIKNASQNLSLARSEEAKKRYDVAAELYAKVGLGKPSAEVFERAASCLLAAGKDLRRAADLAKQALTMAPDSVDLHLLLAKIYVQASMDKSALSELERAAKLAPHDARIKIELKRLKRGDG